MTLTQNSPTVKVISPTLHLYYYVLRHGINESPETLKERRKFFSDNLNQIASHLTSSTGIKGSNIVKLIPPEKEHYGTVLDFDNVPPECRKSNNDRLYFETGILHSRLAARRFNDTYFLRLTRYVSNQNEEQSLKLFENLCEHLNNLNIELGETVILAGIFTPQSSSQSPDSIAAECLNYYYNKTIPADEIIANEFLGSPFYIYPQKVPFKQIGNNPEYTVESTKLTCVFLYKDDNVERQADAVYKILQNLLLSYHKINFFYSQSLFLKKILAEKYKTIEQLTEDYNQRKWDSLSLVKLPQQSLDYYKKLSFLEDQARLVEVHLTNYREYLQQIEQKTGQPVPAFLAKFEKDTEFYLEQMKSNIGFLSPGIQLYEKLMLSVQTQVSISEKFIKDRQAKLGQLLTGVGSAIAVGQIISQPMTSTLSLQLDKGEKQPSVTSLWLGALLTIFVSVMFGYFISIKVYQWFTKDKF